MIDRPGAPQTEIRIGAPAVARRHSDALPLFVASRIFAGGYDSLIPGQYADYMKVIMPQGMLPYNRIAPLVASVEDRVELPVGMSLLAVARA